MSIFDKFKKKLSGSEEKEAKVKSINDYKPEEPKIQSTVMPTNEEETKADTSATEAKSETPVHNIAEQAAPESTEPQAQGDPNLTDFNIKNKTQIIISLCKIPIEKRDQKWVDEFLKNIPFALVKVGDPQIISGPDNKPYCNLMTLEDPMESPSFLFEQLMMENLFPAGAGIALNVQKTSNANPENTEAGAPDFVFSYGDIVNYAVKRDFFNAEGTFFNNKEKNEEVDPNEQVQVGQPAEFILPNPTRAILKQYFEQNGVKNAKVMLLSQSVGKENMTQDLVFNVTPKDFDNNEETFQKVMNDVHWFLPRHYSYRTMDESTIPANENPFMSLDPLPQQDPNANENGTQPTTAVYPQPEA